MSTKAQKLTYDFFFATSVLLIALTATFFYVYHKIQDIEEEKIKGEMVGILISVSDVWFKEGYPEYWDSSNVVEIGLSNNNQINSTKVKLMEDLGYQKVASLLGLGLFNFQYSVYSQNGTLIYSFPNLTFEMGKNVLVLDRTTIWNESIVKVRTIIWQEA